MEDRYWEPLPDGYEEDRPWGKFKVISDTPTHKIKEITINPKSRLSLQKHYNRSEHWYVLRGELTVEKGLAPDGVAYFTLKEGEFICIPKDFWHRASNTTDSPVLFLEVQRGTYFGEDDIVRAEDDYGRVK